MKKKLLSFAAMLLALNVSAQDAKPTEQAVDVPKHTCKKPEDPGRLASDTQMKNFRMSVDAFRDCLTIYRDAMNKRAKAHVDAANSAIQEFNDYVATLNTPK